MEIVLISIAIVLLAALFFFIFRKGSKKQFLRFSRQIALLAENLSTAEQKKLSKGKYSATKVVEEPRLEGQTKEHKFRIFSDTEDTSKDRLATYIEFEISNPRQLKAMIFRERWVAKTGKLLGMPDIQLDHKALDSLYVFKTQEGSKLLDFLGAELRAALLGIADSFHGDLQIEEQKLRYRHPYYMDSDEQRQHVEQLFAFCQVVAEKLDEQ